MCRIITFFVFLMGLSTPNGSAASTLSYDVGLVSGSLGNVNYTEAHVGLNFSFLDFLVWRNSVFGRFANTTAFGLDSTLRLQQMIGDANSLALGVYGGGGYRFITAGRNAPLVEAGVLGRFGGLGLGVGIRSILNSVADSGATNDTQYMLVLTGGGVL